MIENNIVYVAHGELYGQGRDIGEYNYPCKTCKEAWVKGVEWLMSLSDREKMSAHCFVKEYRKGYFDEDRAEFCLVPLGKGE